MNREQVREAVRPVISIHTNVARTIHVDQLADQVTDAIMALDKPPTVPLSEVAQTLGPAWGALQAERDKYREACVWALDALLGMPKSAREGEGDAVIKQLRDAIRGVIDGGKPPAQYIRVIKPTVTRTKIRRLIFEAQGHEGTRPSDKYISVRNKAVAKICAYLTAQGVNVEE